jgi:hypothetical protein
MNSINIGGDKNLGVEKILAQVNIGVNEILADKI